MSTTHPVQAARDAIAATLHDQLARLDVAAQRHDSQALRSLAALRRGAGRRFGDPYASPELMRLVGKRILLEEPFRDSPRIARTLDDAVAVAALVARSRPVVRRSREGRGSLGRDLRGLLVDRRAENVEAQLTLLLGAAREDLPRHLRRTIALLGSDRLGLDVEQLVLDLGAWERDDREVQRRWAFHFWIPDHVPAAAASDRQPEPTLTTDLQPETT